MPRPNELGDEARSSVTELELTVITSTDDNDKTEQCHAQYSDDQPYTSLTVRDNGKANQKENQVIDSDQKLKTKGGFIAQSLASSGTVRYSDASDLLSTDCKRDILALYLDVDVDIDIDIDDQLPEENLKYINSTDVKILKRSDSQTAQPYEHERNTYEPKLSDNKEIYRALKNLRIEQGSRNTNNATIPSKQSQMISKALVTQHSMIPNEGFIAQPIPTSRAVKQKRRDKKFSKPIPDAKKEQVPSNEVRITIEKSVRDVHSVSSAKVCSGMNQQSKMEINCGSSFSTRNFVSSPIKKTCISIGLKREQPNDYGLEINKFSPKKTLFR